MNDCRYLILLVTIITGICLFIVSCVININNESNTENNYQIDTTVVIQNNDTIFNYEVIEK